METEGAGTLETRMSGTPETDGAGTLETKDAGKLKAEGAGPDVGVDVDG